MKQKESLIEAEAEAKALSIKCPTQTYYVLDKHRGKACCLSIDFIIREKIAFENYYGVCRYQNGVRSV